jgi:hypothetical protein
VIAAIAALSIGFFVAGVSLLRIPKVAAGALSTSSRAMATLRDASDDRAREHAMQQASLRLAGSFVSMLLRTALALGLALVPVGVAGVAGLVAPGDVVVFLSRWQVGLTATIVVGGGYFAWTHWWITS